MFCWNLNSFGDILFSASPAIYFLTKCIFYMAACNYFNNRMELPSSVFFRFQTINKYVKYCRWTIIALLSIVTCFSSSRTVAVRSVMTQQFLAQTVNFFYEHFTVSRRFFVGVTLLHLTHRVHIWGGSWKAQKSHYKLNTLEWLQVLVLYE